jgi:hypothetical protein
VALCCRAMEEESVQMVASSPRIDAAGDRDDVDDLRAQHRHRTTACIGTRRNRFLRR